MIITIDGPAGTGKSSVAKKIAELIGYEYFDTGAMYRCVAWFFLKKNCDLSSEHLIFELMEHFNLEIVSSSQSKRYIVNQQDVTDLIRTEVVNKHVSQVAAISCVRSKLTNIQKKYASGRNAVFEGRDMGSVVFPEADFKFFLTASPEIRADRRWKESQETLDYQTVLTQILNRDLADSSRQIAPLSPPKKCKIIDTSGLKLEEVVTTILKYLQGGPKKRFSSWLYRISSNFIFWILKILYKYECYEASQTYDGGAFIAANHTSFLDPMIIGASYSEEVNFLARESLFKNPLFGGLISRLGAHPINRSQLDKSTFKLIEHLLSKRKKIIIFPEGTRSPTGELQKAKAGLGVLLSLTKTAVIPVYIKGPYDIWNTHMKKPRLKGKIVSVWGSPLLWSDFAHLEKKKAQEAIIHEWEAAISRLKDWYEKGAEGSPP
ncbi:MAG: (d)CMP kinase [Rhabdochlamydiaceae bacterium]